VSGEALSTSHKSRDEPFEKGDEMAELLVLEFEGVTEADYRSVNTQLGLDPDTGKGDWPAGLITHLAGLAGDGHAFVVETWTSRQAQEEFMENRLGAAMAQGGVAAILNVTWVPLIGEHHPAG
jgi:hypothetical protein